MAITNKNHILLLLMGLMLCTGMSMDIYIPSLPRIAIDLNATPQQMGWTLGAFVISGSLSGLIASVFSDRFGRKFMLLITSSLFSIASILLMLSTNISYFIFFRIIQGCAAGFNTIITRQIVKDVFKSEKEQINILSLLYIAFVFSPAISPFLGALITYCISWRMCFLVIALIQILIFIFVKSIFNETSNTRRPFPHPMTFIGSYVIFFFTRNFNASALISGMIYGCYFGFYIASSFVFIKTLGFNLIVYSIIFTIISFFFMLSNLLLRYLNNSNITKSKIIFYGCFFNIIGSVSLLLCVITTSKILLFIGMLLSAIFMRFGLGLTMPISQIYVMNIFNKNNGQAVGALGFIQSVIGGIAIVLVTSFNNLVLGLFIVNITFAVAALLIYNFILTEIKFSNFKYKILKKILNNKRFKRFIE